MDVLQNHLLFFPEKDNVPINGIPDWRIILVSTTDADTYRWKSTDGEEATRTVAAINYSSGTTGLPKVVYISLYNLVTNGAQTIHVMGTDKTVDLASERFIGMPFFNCSLLINILGFLPPYHAFGQRFSCLIAP